MEPDTSTASSRSRPLAGKGSGSPSHCGRAQASKQQQPHQRKRRLLAQGWQAYGRARRPLSPLELRQKADFQRRLAAVRRWQPGARSSQGSGARTKTQGQANSNMLANPDRHRLVEAGDGLVIQAAMGPIGPFDQHHPPRQAGRRAAAVEKSQPGPAAEHVWLWLCG